MFAYIKEGNLEEVKRIHKSLPQDQFLKMKLYSGYSMLIFAVTQGYLDIVKFLVENGADVNEASDVSSIVFGITKIEW